MISQNSVFVVITTLITFHLVSLTLSQSTGFENKSFSKGTRPATPALPPPRTDGESCGKIKTNCQTCISQGCAWCLPPSAGVEVFERPECISPTENDSKCPDGWTLENPQGSVVGSNDPSDPADYSISLTPKNFKLNLRVGQQVDIPLKLHISENQELDLYYLTDISTSMADDLNLVKKMGQDLEQTLESKTTKFSIGFGTFIDKNTIPYNYDDDQSSTSPDGCHSTFGFCNAMPLKEDAGEEFNEAVTEAIRSVASNKDALEGGLDALLQVLVCGDAIGWRDSARKLVLFTTGDGFKYEGDGKLAGINEINDGDCHLDSRNKTYTHSLLQDYPSIAQIQAAGKASGVNVVFAVTKRVMPLYQALETQVHGSRTAEITEDSSNIQDIIIDEFSSIVSTLELTSDAPTRLLKVAFSYDCPKGGPQQCMGLELGTTVDIIAHVTLLVCPPAGAPSVQVHIDSTGLHDKVTLDVSYICSCDCQQHSVVSSPRCSGSGSYSCGLCHCGPDRYGALCQCSGKEQSDSKKCVAPQSKSICSGIERGQCICGVCQCKQLASPNEYQGKYCECSNFECPKSGGVTCGGHGACKCNKCVCKGGWTGDTCTCDTNTNNCRASDSAVECSGHGTCRCNKCDCALTHKDDTERYTGKLCNDCPTCSGECEAMSVCASCHLSSRGDKEATTTADECKALANECYDTLVTLGEQADVSDMSECVLETDTCRRVFYYRLSTNGTHIYISDKWACETSTLVIVLSVIGSIVAVGILTLIIWICVDRSREAQRAKKLEADGKDSMNQASNLNQLYKDPNVKVQNPMFGKNI